MIEDWREHLANVLQSLREIRSPILLEEVDLHELVMTRLKESGIPFEAEYRLGPRDRIDFLAEGGIGIECKKGIPNATRLRLQVERYLRHDRIRSMVVVSPWKRHLPHSGIFDGKQMVYLGLNELWGLSV